MDNDITWLVDISHWQGDINIGAIAREGYSACVCKATEGRTFNDSRFDRNVPLIKAAGLIPGAYHHLRADNGAAQARHFFQRVTKHGGPDGWLIQLDCESDGHGTEMTAWTNEWNRLTGNHPFFIYSGAWWWPRTNGFHGANLTPYLWHSRYVPGAGLGAELYEQVPASSWTPGYGGWSQATILQFSPNGRIAGQEIDVNAFRGTVDQLRKLATTPSTPHQPRAVPPYPGDAFRYVEGRPLMKGADIHRWQQRMHDRGWRIDVDGEYGPQSAKITAAFQKEKRLKVDGVVGPETWSAAWTAPIT